VVRNEDKFFELSKKLGVKPEEYDLKSEDNRQVSWSDRVDHNGLYLLYPKGMDFSEGNESEDDKISLPSDTSALDVSFLAFIFYTICLGICAGNFK
jgi:hypothetical protein